MIRSIKISTKIILLTLVLALVSVVAISFFTYDYNVKASQEKYLTNLNVIADNRASYFNNLFDKAVQGIKVMQQSETLKNNGNSGAPAADAGGGMDLMAMMGPPPGAEPVENDTTEEVLTTSSSDSPLKQYLIDQKDIFGYEQIYITSTTGSVIAASDNKTGNFLDPDGSTFLQAQTKIYVSAVQQDSTGVRCFIAGPVSMTDGTHLIIAKVNIKSHFDAVLKDYHGLGEHGDVIIAHKNPKNAQITIISPTRDNAILQAFDTTDVEVASIKDLLNHKPVSQEGVDYRDKNVLQALRKIDIPNWALVAKIDTDEASGETGVITRVFIYAGLCIVAIAILLAMTMARSLTRPLHDMRNKLGMVAQGVLPESTGSHRRDEFGMMENKVDELVETLKGNADFAQKIGEGKYDTEFKPASENDLLGMSLINMRNNLIENERRDKERNWIVRGVAEISEILRMHDSTDELGEDVIKFILEKIGAIQGAFYVVNDDDGKPIIEMRASYAYNRKKYLKAKFKMAEGLVGQAAVEKDTVMRTEIPDDYVTLTSGILGDQRPKCVLIVPLITNEEVYGILEFAGFRKFDPSQVKFVQELSLILARTIFNIKVNERTRKLLAESQEMSNELKEKQEVLRQNAEEMQATQEELKRSNQKLEEQIEEVNRTQKRMQLLLENASEVITIYEEDETIRYISPSVETILGYGQKELIGHSDIDKVHPDYREIFRDLFKKMVAQPDDKITVQYEYKTREGNYIWIESSGTNVMANPAIHGFILNSRDITERRRGELEQRMRSKMQALSENSLDLITRLENGEISYINPVIEQYTGKSPSSFLNRKAKDTELDASVLESWLRIVEEVNNSNDKITTEMDFPSEMGARVMQVNAIPEFDESDKLESVLVVSHDITERKMIELEIQNKNKKITESINYAKRIQTAILPSTRIIIKALPDSFILYKPRDVVSGDFPWFMQVKDEIFIAAVDCTGHGVPGALLSLIGYFLLNDIVRSRKITEPGKILDLLDEGVTTTLRQDEDSTTKDGMDIALCKINMQTREVEYAGAHRPLYIMKGGVMDEVKGNKFPIGGGIFKNQTNFTNTRIVLNPGDSIYFSSDGFPDQFGGPEGRKFGPKRTREVIESVHTKPMAEAVKVFDDQWEGWRGDHKQTDDVLLIGIKF